MKRLLLTALTVALLPAGSWISAQTKATATNVAIIPHEAVPNFFKHPPGIYTGENMGIATNSNQGNIFVFGLANSIDCRNENELLVGEMTNWRVQKVSLK